MSREYAEKRIKDALVKSNGNAVKARQLVTSWCAEDQKLLHALTKAHLTGIIAYNIERIASGRSARGSEKTAPTQKQTAKKEENFGMELLKAVAGNGGLTFGLEGSAVPKKRTKVSKEHLDAILAMTQKPKGKR